MSAMFYGCAAFNQSVSNFNTAAVKNMFAMFQGCTAFNQDISTFDVSRVATTASGTWLDNFMFGATAFSTANLDAVLKAWNTAKAGPPATGTNHRPTFATAVSAAGGGVAARDALKAYGLTFTMAADKP